MRIEQLTFTRFIAAVAVVIYHYGLQTSLFGNDFTKPLFEQAYSGVSYFFLLSGFVLIIATKDKPNLSYGRFMQSRIGRLYPLYLGIVLLMTLHTGRLSVPVQDLLLAMSLTQAFVPGKAQIINYAAWSLSVEFFFYLIFPLLLQYVYRRSRWQRLVPVVLLLWLLTQCLYHFVFDTGDASGGYMATVRYYPLMHLNEFVIGNLAGMYYISTKTQQYKSRLPLIVLLTIVLALVLYNSHNEIYYGVGLLAPIYIGIIVLLAQDNSLLSRIFRHRIAVYQGEISYGIYILQECVWSALTDERLQRLLNVHIAAHPDLFFLLRLVVLILLSALSYQLLEQPSRRWINRLGRSQQ